MLIEVQGLSKRYRPRGPMVVEEVSFTIDRGETLAIFGDSGSGKSTIGQILAGIYPATAGEVWLDGQRLSYPLRGPARRRIQILFQHPEVAFNPKLRLIEQYAGALPPVPSALYPAGTVRLSGALRNL
ncbi:ATP-binding cassette domain-containing protein [Flavonifractor plautii]|uniref:ATP-binding cassette domain-containing protein n=1 Tax=Flavonifractor plautii TaxID=292800 RepID=UPI003EEFEB5D